MKVFVTNQPYMLYETVEVLRRYVNGDTPEDLSTEKPSDPGQSQPEHLPGFLHCVQQL